MATYGYALNETQYQRLGEVLATVPGGSVGNRGTGQGRQPALIQCGSSVSGPSGQTWFNGLIVWIDADYGGNIENFSDGYANVWLVGVNSEGAGVLLGEGEFYNAVCVGRATLAGEADARPVYAVGVPCDWTCTEIVTANGLRYLSGHQCVTTYDYCATMGGSSSSSGESSSSSSLSSSSSTTSTSSHYRVTDVQLYQAGCYTILATTRVLETITKTLGGIVLNIEEGEPELLESEVYNCWDGCCSSSSSASSEESSSSSSSSGGIQTECCENPIPETLFVTFDGGSCGGTYEMTYFMGEWIAEDAPATMRLQCYEGIGFEMNVDFDTIGFDIISCSPLLLQCNACTTGACGSVDVTVTE